MEWVPSWKWYFGYLFQFWCCRLTQHPDTVVSIGGHTVTILKSDVDPKMKVISQFTVLFYEWILKTLLSSSRWLIMPSCSASHEAHGSLGRPGGCRLFRGRRTWTDNKRSPGLGLAAWYFRALSAAAVHESVPYLFNSSTCNRLWQDQQLNSLLRLAGEKLGKESENELQ